MGLAQEEAHSRIIAADILKKLFSKAQLLSGCHDHADRNGDVIKLAALQRNASISSESSMHPGTGRTAFGSIPEPESALACHNLLAEWNQQSSQQACLELSLDFTAAIMCSRVYALRECIAVDIVMHATLRGRRFKTAQLDCLQPLLERHVWDSACEPRHYEILQYWYASFACGWVVLPNLSV